MASVKNLAIALASAGFTVLAAAGQALAVSLTYNSSIGSPGFAPGQLFVPQGIGVQDSTNLVFVSNGRGQNPDGTFNPALGNRVDVFDQQGNYIRSVGSGRQGSGIGLDEPADLKFSPVNGEMHVGDVFNSEIDVYNPDSGEYVRSYGSFSGPVPGRFFFGPGGMSFDGDANLWITDFSGDRIKKYDGTTGDLIGTYGSAGSGIGQFSGPAGLTVSPNTGRLYVTDQYNGRIQVFQPNASGDELLTPLFTIGSPGREPGQLSEAIGIEVDEFENILVADSVNSRVQVFDRDGNFVSTFGEPVRNAAGEIVPPPALGGPPFGDPLDLTPGKFNWTAGAHYDDGKLYVGDFFQGRVQVLDISYDESTAVPEPSSVLGLAVLGAGAAAFKFSKQRRKSLKA